MCAERGAVVVAALLALATAAAAQPTAGPAPAPELGDDVARPETIEVRGRAAAPAPAAAVLDRTAARATPGAAADAVLAVRGLAALARIPAGGRDVVLWGAAAAESVVLLDDVPIPALFHRGGARGVVPDGVLGAIVVTPAAFGARLGRATGGAVELTTAPAAPGRHAALAIDPVDTLVTASVAGRRDHVVASARQGYLDRWLPRLSDDLAALAPVAAHRDAYLRVGRDEGGTASAVWALASADRVRRAVPSRDPAAAGDERLDDTTLRLAARRKRRAGGTRGVLVAWIGRDAHRRRASFGDVPVALSAETTTVALRAEHRRVIGGAVLDGELIAGLDLQAARHLLDRAGTLALPAREGDPVVFGQPPPGQVGADRWRVDQLAAAPYLGAALTAFDGALSVTPGVRLEPQVTVGDRQVPAGPAAPAVGYDRFDLVVEPRLAVAWRPARGLELIAAGGVHHRPADPADLSPVFGRPRLPPSRALALLVGGRLRPRPWLDLELTLHGRRVSDVAARSSAAPPDVAAALEPSGRARGVGAELTARGRGLGLDGQVSLSHARARRDDGSAAPWRPADTDPGSALLATLARQPARGFGGSARLRAASGRRRTEVVGAYQDVLAGRAVPLLGPTNAVRLPTTIELDAQLGWRGRLDAYDVAAWVELINLLGRANPEEVAYDHDFRERRDLGGLPFLAFVGLRVER